MKTDQIWSGRTETQKILSEASRVAKIQYTYSLVASANQNDVTTPGEIETNQIWFNFMIVVLEEEITNK